MKEGRKVQIVDIRESVDSLYRDDAGEISRDPRKKTTKNSVRITP